MRRWLRRLAPQRPPVGRSGGPSFVAGSARRRHARRCHLAIIVPAVTSARSSRGWLEAMIFIELRDAIRVDGVALWHHLSPPAAVAGAAVIDTAWIGLLAYGLVRLL